MNNELWAGRVIHDADMPAAESFSLAGGQVVVRSLACPGGGGRNEDAALLMAVPGNRAVVAVADGVGGAPAGHSASRGALQALQHTLGLYHPDDGAPLRVAVLNGIERANRAVLDDAAGAATTLMVAEVDAGQVRIYHVGDSAALIVGQRGRVRWQSIPHSPVGFAVESGLLDEEEAMLHADRHLVSNVVGDEAMRIDIGPTLRLATRDTVLLASDGLFDNLHTAEIVEAVRKGPLAAAVDRLFAQALDRMQGLADGPCKPDDLTVVAFRLTPVSGKAGRTRSPRSQMKLI